MTKCVIPQKVFVVNGNLPTWYMAEVLEVEEEDERAEMLSVD
jgi:hypothetical protein